MPEHAGDAQHALDRLTTTMLEVGLLLEAAVELPGAAARLRINEALSLVDGAVRAARDHIFTEASHEAQTSRALSPLDEPHRSRWFAARADLLHERMLETARGLQRSAQANAALLEQRAALVQDPSQADYPTEIKRWRSFADQAEHLAHRLERDHDRESAS